MTHYEELLIEARRYIESTLDCAADRGDWIHNSDVLKSAMKFIAPDLDNWIPFFHNDDFDAAWLRVRDSVGECETFADVARAVIRAQFEKDLKKYIELVNE